jgi:ribonuclease inhibitor
VWFSASRFQRGVRDSCERKPNKALEPTRASVTALPTSRWLSRVTGRVAQLGSLADMYRRAENRLEIDVGDAATRQGLHDLLFEAFQFPDYYGSNWDAFDECIRDVPVPDVVQITGFQKLQSRLPRDAELLRGCLEDFAQGHEPKIAVQIS